MKKSNVILQAAVAGALLAMFGSANAATAVSTTSVKYAVEQFLGTTPSAAVVAPTMNIVAATAIPAGSTVTVMVELTGGIFGATQTGHATNVAGANIVSTVALGATDTTGMVTLGSTLAGTTTAAAGVGGTATATTNNANVVVLRMTTTVAIGIGGTIATITTPTISAAGLASTAATVTANATILVGSIAAPVGAAVPTTGLLEAASGATNIATSAQGVALTAAAGTAGQIDLTATPVSSAFTGAITATMIDLGTVTATDGTAKLVTANNAAYNIAAKATKTMTTTVTAPAGFFAALKTSGLVALYSDACVTALAGATSTAFTTNALAAAATSVSTAATQPTSATAYHVCMSIPASSATSVALVPGTPTLTATLGAAAAQDSAETLAATNLWPLAYNGSTYNVRNYVPAAATGYNTFVRVINTGAVSAAVSVALIDATTGTAGTAGVLGTLAAGAARNFTPQEIEAATGAVAATARPRLRITAPTNGLNVQTFLAQPVGAGLISDMTGAQ